MLTLSDKTWTLSITFSTITGALIENTNNDRCAIVGFQILTLVSWFFLVSGFFYFKIFCLDVMKSTDL